MVKSCVLKVWPRSPARLEQQNRRPVERRGGRMLFCTCMLCHHGFFYGVRIKTQPVENWFAMGVEKTFRELHRTFLFDIKQLRIPKEKGWDNFIAYSRCRRMNALNKGKCWWLGPQRNAFCKKQPNDVLIVRWLLFPVKGPYLGQCGPPEQVGFWARRETFRRMSQDLKCILQEYIF